MVSFAKKTKFPWLMSNVFLKNSTVTLGEGKIWHILEKNGLKVILCCYSLNISLIGIHLFQIGLIGLIEEEWLSTLVLVSIVELVAYDLI